MDYFHLALCIVIGISIVAIIAILIFDTALSLILNKIIDTVRYRIIKNDTTYNPFKITRKDIEDAVEDVVENGD